jgi:hypothetical protein
MNIYVRISTIIIFAIFGYCIPHVAFCQNQYIQNWTIHTDSTNDYISTQHLHLNGLAQSLVALSTMSDSIELYKADSSGTLLWMKKYNFGPFENRIAGKIASDSDFNYYLTVRSQQGSTRLVKLDSAGNVLLNLPDTINDYLFTFPAWSYPPSVLVDCDLNYLYVAKRFYNNNPYVYYITKFDHQFNSIWTRKLSSAYYNAPYYFSVDINGTIHAMIDTLEQGGDTLRSFRLSFDSNGDTLIYHNLWKNKFMNTHWSSTIDEAGRAVLTLRYDTATWTSTPPSIVIARFDTSGVIMWSDTIWSSLTQGEDPAGLYGDSWGNAYLLSYQTYSQSNILAKRRIYLRKYDSMGQQIWFRSWEGNDSTTFLFRPPYLKYFDENNIFVTGAVVNSGSYFDALVAKTDSAGNYLWQSNFSANNDLRETFSVLERDLCNNIYVLGLTDSLTAAGSFLRLVRYITETPCFTSENDIGSEIPDFSIYPNPTTGNFTLVFDKTQDKHKIRVSDLPGRVLYETTFENSNFLHISINLNPGIYFVEVEGMGMQRLIVAHK